MIYSAKQTQLTRIRNFGASRDVNSLRSIRDKFMRERFTMDRWFDKYLEKFERKMSPDETDTNIWKLYKTKLNEYSDLNEIIKTADIYIKRCQSTYV